MKKYIFLTVFFAAASLFALEPVERYLTMDESLTTGINNNQEFLAATEQIPMAQQRVNEAMTLRLPKIDYNFSASEYEGGFPTVLSPSFNSMYLPQGSGQYYSTRFSLWQYLYAAGKYTTSLRLAQTNLSQARSQADNVKNRIIRDVKKSFFALIAAKNKVALMKRAVSDPAFNKLPNEKLVRLLEEYEYGVSQAKLDLLRVLGLEMDTAFEITGDINVTVTDYELNKCLAWASQYRPELTQTQFQEAIDTLKVNLSMAERYPTITMGANYELIGSQFPLQNNSWNATVNFNLPIFDGWATWYRIKQGRHQSRESKIQRAKIGEDIRYEVRSALLAFNYWKGQISALGNYRAVNDPEKTLENEIKKIDTLNRFAASQVDIDWATGRFLMGR